MADKNVKRRVRAQRRRLRVRGKVQGTGERPRLSVAKSLNHVYVQLIDDEQAITLAAAASNTETVTGRLGDDKTKIGVAKVVGQVIAEAAKEKGIESVVFDRNQYRYHGRVKAVADGAREGGLKF